MHAPHGPHKIATNGQVVVPKEFLQTVGLTAGDAVYVQALDEPGGGILIVPAALAARWFEAGRVQEKKHADE